MNDIADRLKSCIREVPDFPKPGILFKDITPLLQDPQRFREAIDAMGESCRRFQPDVVAAMEARGFVFGAAVAHALGIGFVPVRKKGKLPHKTFQEEYSLEYGTDILEIHEDAFAPYANKRCVIVDDVLATGGTAEAVARLIVKAGGTVVGCVFLVELKFLKGADRLRPYAPHTSLIRYGE